MIATYVQPGEFIDYINPTTNVIQPGEVVSLTSRIAVAGCEIKPGEKGSLATEGVYSLTKTSTDTVIALGAKVCYDGTGIVLAQAEKDSNVPVGYAIQASSATDTTVLVKLMG